MNQDRGYHYFNDANFKKQLGSKKGFISNTNLFIIAFATIFFPRILDSLGAPAPINFLHFILVPFVFISAIHSNRSNNRKRLKVMYLLIWGLFFLLLTIIASAFINQAGIINAFLSFMLLGEAFIFLILIISFPWDKNKFKKIKKIILSFFVVHLLLVFIQKYILRTDTWEWVGMEGADRIQGVFFISGAGHVVGSSVSLTFALYYLLQEKDSPLWLRILVLLAAIWNIVIADGKQVLFVFMAAMILLFLLRLNHFVTAIKYVVSGTILAGILWWCAENLEAFGAFKTWLRPDIYGLDGEATMLKTSVFRIIPTYYDSLLNWFFGLGPGHTVGRLGGWMLREYESLLSPLGSTIHPASREVWRAVGQSWLGSQSSMFSPLFGWAGIWGDLGLVGLSAYFYLGFIVWKYICKNDLMRFFLLTAFIFGWIFSQLEEPGYMLSVACIIGINYQKHIIDQTEDINRL